MRELRHSARGLVVLEGPTEPGPPHGIPLSPERRVNVVQNA